MVKQDGKVIGYVMTLDGAGPFMFLGCTPEEVGASVTGEFRGHLGEALDGIGTYTIEAREFTRDEIDNMPEFPGW